MLWECEQKETHMESSGKYWSDKIHAKNFLENSIFQIVEWKK